MAEETFSGSFDSSSGRSASLGLAQDDKIWAIFYALIAFERVWVLKLTMNNFDSKAEAEAFW
jgi:hypothetical protein